MTPRPALLLLAAAAAPLTAATALASFTLSEENKDPYPEQNLFDGNPSTCWAANNGGVGRYFFVSVPERTPAIRITNGYVKRKELFAGNNRVKALNLRLV